MNLLKAGSIGFRSGLNGGRYATVAPAASIASFTPRTLWLDRSSITTMPPGLSSRTRCCRTHARDVAPLIGPSTRSRATNPVVRIADRNVVVDHRACGVRSTRRVPRGLRP